MNNPSLWDRRSRWPCNASDATASASNRLVDRAQKPREAVESMRLRQATADAAHDLVVAGLAHIAAVGRNRAFADLQAQGAGLIDRDPPAHAR